MSLEAFTHVDTTCDRHLVGVAVVVSTGGCVEERLAVGVDDGLKFFVQKEDFWCAN